MTNTSKAVACMAFAMAVIPMIDVFAKPFETSKCYRIRFDDDNRIIDYEADFQSVAP